MRRSRPALPSSSRIASLIRIEPLLYFRCSLRLVCWFIRRTETPSLSKRSAPGWKSQGSLTPVSLMCRRFRRSYWPLNRPANIAGAFRMKYILFAYSLLLTGILPLAAQEGGSKAKMIIILDASGSMTEKIEGNRTKIEIAKQVVGDLIRSLDPRIDVGFMVYGHRAKGDCDDIELMVPPEASDHEMILKRLAQIQPKGRTPICGSVLKAAEALRYTEDKASVVIVTDGEETCGGDPCLLGKKLRDTGVDFKTHIVGFGLEKGEGAGLKCLANETKGMFLEARDTATLTSALNATVRKVAQSESTPQPQPSAAVPGMGRLQVSVYQTDGGQPILN